MTTKEDGCSLISNQTGVLPLKSKPQINNIEKKQENKREDRSLLNGINTHFTATRKEQKTLFKYNITGKCLPQIKRQVNQDILAKAQRIRRYEECQSFFEKTNSSTPAPKSSIENLAKIK